MAGVILYNIFYFLEKKIINIIRTVNRMIIKLLKHDVSYDISHFFKRETS